MKTGNFIAAGIAGGISDFLLGWVFYGILFHEYFATGEPNMAMIVGGCMSFGFLISYIFVRWANLMTFSSGAMGGAVLGIIMGFMNNFFMFSDDPAVDWTRFLLDVGISIVIGALVGGVVAAINGAMSRKAG